MLNTLDGALFSYTRQSILSAILAGSVLPWTIHIALLPSRQEHPETAEEVAANISDQIKRSD